MILTRQWREERLGSIGLTTLFLIIWPQPVSWASYLGMFAAVFYISAKRYIRRNKFWVPAITTVFLIAYFIHLLTVFDMPASYMMFFLVLGLIASYKGRPVRKIKYVPKKYGIGAAIAAVCLISLFVFVFQPIKAGTKTIKAIQTIPGGNTIEKVMKDNPNQLGNFLKSNSEGRLNIYKTTLNASPMGKYQIRNFFAQHSHSLVESNIQQFPLQVAKKDLIS